MLPVTPNKICLPDNDMPVFSNRSYIPFALFWVSFGCPLRACILGVLLAASTLIRPHYSLRPPVARASRPLPAGSDTRRCSCLRAGRLTRTRWVSYWQPLPDKPIPYQRKPFLPRAPGKSCSKAIHAFERFSPSSAARGAARHPNRAASTLTSLYPYKPIPISLYPTRENCPQAGQAPRARGGQ